MTVAEPEITDATPAHTPVGMPEPRPSAVLDSAHLGDIEGALGRISLSDKESRRTFKARMLTMLAIVGLASSSWSVTTTPAVLPPTRRPARTTGTRCFGCCYC